MNQYLQQHLKSLGFASPQCVTGRASIASVYAKGKRCGIYVLVFDDGEVYAGQAVDVTRRYVQHSKTYDDIQTLYFQRVAKARLNEVERDVIQALEREGYHLRNITFTSLPKGESDFDLVMAPSEQQAWLVGRAEKQIAGPRVNDDALRRKYERKFQQLSQMPNYEDAEAVLRTFVRKTIPVPAQSEVSFWACSCLPGFASKSIKLYSRININWQEVMTVYTEAGQLYVSIHLAASPLQAAYGKSLFRLRLRHPRLKIIEHQYPSGGQDQINLKVKGLKAANALMANPHVVQAAKLFNLRLMQKGPCNSGRNHCLALADRLLDLA